MNAPYVAVPNLIPFDPPFAPLPLKIELRMVSVSMPRRTPLFGHIASSPLLTAQSSTVTSVPSTMSMPSCVMPLLSRLMLSMST